MRRVLGALAMATTLLMPVRADVVNATPAMWVVHSPEATVYLLGSIHVLPKGVRWQTPEITAAMKRASTFVFEVRMDAGSRDEARTAIQETAMFSVSTALPALFDAKMMDDYRQVVRRTHVNADHLTHLRPWLAAMVLEGAAEGGSGELELVDGVDAQVYAWARKHKIRNFGALETNDLQLSVLRGGGTLNDELGLLRLTFKKILTTKPHPAGLLFAAWTKGDTKTLAALGPDDPNVPPEIMKPLLENRNRAWIPEIEAMLHKPGTTFITVGAAHLVGKIGVPTLLREKGYTVDDPGTACCANPPALRLSTSD